MISSLLAIAFLFLTWLHLWQKQGDIRNLHLLVMRYESQNTFFTPLLVMEILRQFKHIIFSAS